MRLLGEVLAADAELVLLLAAHAQVLRDVLGGLAHRDVEVGQVAVLARVGPRVGATLGALRGAGDSVGEERVLRAGQASAMPLANRLTVSTPAEMNTSPSPALIAWSAMRVVCRLDEQ